MKRYGTLILLIILALVILLATGCETQAQNKALIGGAIGAGAGQAIGRDTEATLIGGAIGAGAGYLWGKSEDNKKAQSAPPQQMNTRSAEANTVTVWITNSNDSQTPVKLVRNPDGTYTGPKGERYAAMPTEQQLKKAYGF